MNSFAKTALGTASAVVVALSCAACSSSGHPANAADGAPGPSASDSAPGATPAKPHHTSPTGPVNGRGVATPDRALSTFLVDVIKGDFRGACRMTAELKNNGSLAPSRPANCAAASTNQQVMAVFRKLQKQFTPTGANPSTPSVAVSGVAAGNRTSVRVLPSQITIDGKSSQDVAAADPEQGGFTGFPVDKIGNRWYVVSFL
jgi:hypothetical protein